MNGFAAEIVLGLDEADGSAAGAHEHGVRGGHGASHLNTPEKRPGADASGGKEDIPAPGKVLGDKLVVQFVSPSIGYEGLALGFITRPDFRAHPAAQAAEAGS